MYGRGYGGGGGQIGFGPPVTPPIIKQLLIANLAIFFIAQVFIGPTRALYLFGVVPSEFWGQGFIWQPFTYMWLHAPNSLMHIAGNMFSLWMFGSPVAAAWGDRRFLRFYLICGVAAGFVIAVAPYLFPGSATGIPTVGASGAVMGVLLAYSLIWPERTIMLLFPPIPLKAIYLIPLILFVEFTAYGGSNVSHSGHLGGLAAAWVLLRREGRMAGFSLESLKYRWRRYRMRKKLRAVQVEDRRQQERRRHDDQTLH